MNFDLHILTKSGYIQPLEKLIQESATNHIAKIAAMMPVDNVDFIILDQRDDQYNVAQTGDEGLGQFAVSSHLIYISINARKADIQEEIAGNKLLGVLAHAMYHCIRGRNMQWIRGPLLEAFISEGLAGHFEEEMTHERVSDLYTTAKDEDLNKFQQKAEKSYWDNNYNWNNWFMGSDPTVPYGYGHSLGYKIVGDYLKKYPDIRPSILFDKQPQEFIKI